MAKTELFVRKQPGGVFSVVDESRTTGSIFYVHSGTGTDSLARGHNSDFPLATVDYAVALCTANKFDRIYAMPGHAEDITAATSLVMDIDGVSVIGIGSGTLKPTFTFTTAAAALWSITGANCAVKNVRLVSDFTNGITSGITLGAAADGCELIDIDMVEGSSSKEFLIGVTITAACHNVKIRNLNFYGAAGGTCSACILVAGASDNLSIEDCFLIGDFSSSVIHAAGATSVDVRILNNVLDNADATAGLGISMETSSTGVIARNVIGGRKVEAPGTGVVGPAMMFYENYCSNAVVRSGILSPYRDD